MDAASGRVGGGSDGSASRSARNTLPLRLRSDWYLDRRSSAEYGSGSERRIAIGSGQREVKLRDPRADLAATSRSCPSSRARHAAARRPASTSGDSTGTGGHGSLEPRARTRSK